MYRLLRVTALVFLFPLGVAHAQFKTTEQLAELCDPKASGQAGVAICLAYLAGVADALDTTRAANGAQKCLPPNIKITQVGEAWAHFILNNRKKFDSGEWLNTTAASIALLAIGNTWCPTGLPSDYVH